MNVSCETFSDEIASGRPSFNDVTNEVVCIHFKVEEPSRKLNMFSVCWTLVARAAEAGKELSGMLEAAPRVPELKGPVFTAFHNFSCLDFSICAPGGPRDGEHDGAVGAEERQRWRRIWRRSV